MDHQQSEGTSREAVFARLLAEVSKTCMPFGKFGPEHFPPAGVPLYDLPYEYLAWFARKNFPKGRLGTLLEFVYLAKRDGADSMFDPFRAEAGGRHNLRKSRRTHWEFTVDEPESTE